MLENARKKSDGKSRGKAVRAAKKRITREVEGENEKKQYTKEQMGTIDFQSSIKHPKLMLRFDSISKKYQHTNVFQDLTFSLFGGEKTWLLGPNGEGKTTILKLILGEEKPDSGEIRLGENISIGYFAQKQTFLNYEKNLLDHFIEDTSCPYEKAFGNLNRFLFNKDDLKKKVKSLSPGQRARFAFSIFAHKDYDFLILDEPTNHLDIETKEVIEESLSNFKGTLLLVSHDRFFIEKIGITKVLQLKQGNLEILK